MTPETESLIDRALAEDLGAGDPTTDILVPPDLAGRANLVAKAPGVLAGTEVSLAVFSRVDPALSCAPMLRDGDPLEPGSVIAAVEGPVASILKAERTALNFVRRLSGVATETSRYVAQAAGYPARIVDTRKTTPGLRSLEKQAVRAGGGHNHRQNLGDGILIKDNHLHALRGQGLSLADVIERARQRAPHTLRIEVEVEDLAEVEEALDAGAEIILLDNMAVPDVAAAVRLAKGRAVTEASGLIDLATVRSVAATGVDLISVGALTHSSNALDIGLDLL